MKCTQYKPIATLWLPICVIAQLKNAYNTQVKT